MMVVLNMRRVFKTYCCCIRTYGWC